MAAAARDKERRRPHFSNTAWTEREGRKPWKQTPRKSSDAFSVPLKRTLRLRSSGLNVELPVWPGAVPQGGDVLR